MNSSELVTIRDYIEDDKPFILATWLKGLRYGNSKYQGLDSAVYFKFYHSLFSSVLNMATVKVACLTEDLSIILGYAIFDASNLYWVHVKKAWRNIHIASSLIPKTIKTVSYTTKIGEAILKTKTSVKLKKEDNHE